jgi:hypothetical protein
MKTVKIKKQFAIDELDLPFSAVEDIITHSSRWHEHHKIVFEYEGKFYRTTYRVGATEMQEEYPWDDKDEIECTEVRKVQKMVDVWENV